MKDRKAPREEHERDLESETWEQLPWRKLEQHVYRIQKRIFRAERAGKTRVVQKLQKLLLKSEAACLLAVRRVTQENQGKKTAGIDGVKSLTPAQRLELAQSLHPHHWTEQTTPVRRVWIPKPGKTEKRPLGIPTMYERAKQCLVKAVLEPEWEAKFEPNSYGFRPGRSCHDAIEAIFKDIRFQPKYVLDADIAGCFDTLSHELLIEILKEHIHDGRCIKLLQDLLDAGYMENWTYNQTLSGVPQGGIVSPIFSNILLDKLDKFVENVLIPQYTRGSRRKINPEYDKLRIDSRNQRRKGNTEKAEELRKQSQTLPSVMTNDPEYRRLKYVRYADDFLLGFVGPRSEAEEIKQQLRTFLREELKLELSEEKTLITHATSEAARFLGYEITVLQDDTKRTKRTDTGRMCRSINRVIGLRVPEDVVKAKMDRYKKNGEAIQRTELIKANDYTIVLTYQLEFRGIANYYQLAYNMRTLAKLKWVMETSLTKTLASKHKISVSKVYEKYGAMLLVGDKEYKGLQVIQPKPDESKKPLKATWGAIPLKWNSEATLDDQPPRVPINHRTELVQRLLADFCELCGSGKDVEVHHVNAMRKLHEYPGRAKPEWVKRMIALRRKTLVLCKRCHVAVEHGLPITWQLISLDEIKERRKKLNDAILESRMH